jgi:hypothetical protein
MDWEGDATAIDGIATAECHPVPAGVSSSGLHGGAGGAPRVRGYDARNDKPLLRVERPPNAAALGAEAYAREYDGRRWGTVDGSERRGARHNKVGKAKKPGKDVGKAKNLGKDAREGKSQAEAAGKGKDS